MNNQRKCIVTNAVKDKNELIRIVKTKDNTFLISDIAKGRGAYISKDKNLIDDLMKKRLLNRSFKTSVPLEVYNEVKKKLEEVEDGR